MSKMYHNLFIITQEEIQSAGILVDRTTQAVIDITGIRVIPITIKR